MASLSQLTAFEQDLHEYIDSEKVSDYQRFFKTGKGEYGEGDVFLGISVPDQRKVAIKWYKIITEQTLSDLLNSPYHEYRLTALFMMVYQSKRGTLDNKRQMFDLFMSHIDRVNNWDLVDASSKEIVGEWCICINDDSPIIELASSRGLWRERTSIIATFAHIKKQRFDLTLELCKRFIDHHHDLIHKATGWVLREVGKYDMSTLRAFLNENGHIMPRTMLRYAIEKMSHEERLHYLNAKHRKNVKN